MLTSIDAPSNAAAPPLKQDADTDRWGLTRRIAFRVGFLYFAAYAVPLLAFPYSQMRALVILGNMLAPFTTITARVLGFPTPLAAGSLGGGDTLFEWLTHVTLLWLSITGALLWSALARSSNGDARLRSVLHLVVRYALGFVLIYYGVYKIVPFQFPPPGFARLVTQYGQATPEGLLWTFMGASQAYTTAVGMGELAAGVLLLFRRTALLGALLGVGVLTNIVLLNFFYIGGGKLFTVHLLLFALLIISASAKRIISALFEGAGSVRGRSRVQGIPTWVPFALAVIITVGSTVRFGLQAQAARRNFGDLQPQSPLRGLYEVTEFSRNGVPQPPLYTDPTRWRRVAVESARGMVVFGGDDSRRFVPATVDASAGVIMTGRPGSANEGALRYSQSVDGWVLNGVFGGDSLVVHLRSIDPATFPLLRHQFRWVRESDAP